MLIHFETIDKSTLLETVDHNEQLLHALCELFATTVEDHFSQLESALESKDLKGVKAAAHSLLNDGKHVSSHMLIEVAEKIKLLAAKGHSTHIPNYIGVAREAIDTTKSDLTKLFTP